MTKFKKCVFSIFLLKTFVALVLIWLYLRTILSLFVMLVTNQFCQSSLETVQVFVVVSLFLNPNGNAERFHLRQTGEKKKS